MRWQGLPLTVERRNNGPKTRFDQVQIRVVCATLSTHLSRINLCRRGCQFKGTFRDLSVFRLTFVYGIRESFRGVMEWWNVKGL